MIAKSRALYPETCQDFAKPRSQRHSPTLLVRELLTERALGKILARLRYKARDFAIIRLQWTGPKDPYGGRSDAANMSRGCRRYER